VISQLQKTNQTNLSDLMDAADFAREQELPPKTQKQAAHVGLTSVQNVTEEMLY
jgi:hypothetical protein